MKRFVTCALVLLSAVLFSAASPVHALFDENADAVLNYFKCYRIEGKAIPDTVVTVDDPSGRSRRSVNNPVQICVPCTIELPDGRLHKPRKTPERLVLKMYLLDAVKGPEASADDVLFAAPATVNPQWQVLYAVDGASGDAPHLYTINPASGTVVDVIGPVGFADIDGIALHPETGDIYGISNNFFNYPRSSDLIQIDPATGAGSLIGGNNLFHCSDLAFDSTGSLFCWGEGGPDDLVRFNLNNGSGEIVGESGIRTAKSALAFDTSGTLWLKWGRSLYRVDKRSGAARFTRFLDRFFDNILAIDENDLFYSGLHNGEIYTFDPKTGKSTFVGSSGLVNLSAIEFGPEPEPGEFFDNYVCRSEVEERPEEKIVITDPFGESLHTVTDQSHRCIPYDEPRKQKAEKNLFIRQTASNLPHMLKAYRIDPGDRPFQPVTVEVLDRFGKATIRVMAPSYLLVPSVETGH